MTRSRLTGCAPGPYSLSVGFRSERLATDILLIESHEETVGALRAALSPFDVALRVVPDGTRGIVEAEKQKPTAILLGLELPPKNYGYVVCQRLKKSDVTSAVPLILLYASATETDIDRHRTLRHRADAYLKKPFADAQVVSALDQLIGALPRRAVANAGEAQGRQPGNGAAGASPSVEVTLHDDDILFDEDPPFAPPTLEPVSAEGATPRDVSIDLAGDLLADLDSIFPGDPVPKPEPAKPASPGPASVTVRGVTRVPDAVEEPKSASAPDEEFGLKAEVARLTRVAETLRDELDAAKVLAGNEVDAAKKRITELEAAVTGAREKAADALKACDLERAGAALATTRVDELDSRLAELEREVASRDASIATLRAEAEKVEPETETLRAALDEATAAFGDVQTKLDRALQVRERMRRAVEILKTLTDD